MSRSVPELLAPAGSLDAVRAAVANGANAVYLGVERFNARDEGAQLSFDELDAACRLAHSRSARIYLTLNVLVKQHELHDALALLGDAIDRGIDAAIVQDVGLIRLIQRVYPGFEIHGSTQLTVHDASSARLARGLGLDRVVLARENTLDDIRAIRDAVPGLGLEAFVHGALCISYSGQCYMSGMISERSANRGSCAQSCRKDYVLRDAATGAELDRGYLISAKDLAAHDQLEGLADAGIACLKVEGRKKKPEYVATVTHGYRAFLDRLALGETAALSFEEVRPLVQIYSRGFTAGMLVGRAGRDYVTREQPDNRGHEIGVVVGYERGEVLVDVTHLVAVGDGLGFEPPPGSRDASTGFHVTQVRTVAAGEGALTRQAVASRRAIASGWRVVRSAQHRLLADARASFDDVAVPPPSRVPLDVRVFGSAGASLKAVFRAADEEVIAHSRSPLVPARQRGTDAEMLRTQFGRLGESPFVLGELDARALAPDLFVPVSDLNRMRQEAVADLLARRAWGPGATDQDRAARIERAIADVHASPVKPHAGDPAIDAKTHPCEDTAATAGYALVAEPHPVEGAMATAAAVYGPAAESHPVERARIAASAGYALVVETYSVEDARTAATSGATEVIIDPFLRHPTPPARRVEQLRDELSAMDVSLRLRLPTIVRPEERRKLDKWLALDIPVATGHAGLAAELAAVGRDVAGDYALNCFNAHTAAEFFRRGLTRLTASIELTVAELSAMVAPWSGEGFEVVVYGRPEGMTIEHCVLSAAFDRVATTCRDLCVQKHTNVELTDPVGYAFPVATDSACRNRLLHSRPIEGSEFLPRLWAAGIRSYRLLFNVPGESIATLVPRYRQALETLVADGVGLQEVELTRLPGEIREGRAFTRGHFVRAV